MNWFEHLEQLVTAAGCELKQTPKGFWFLITEDGDRLDLGKTPATDGGYARWAKAFIEAGII